MPGWRLGPLHQPQGLHLEGRRAGAIPGAYSQYTTWFPHSLVKLPDNVTNEEGAMAEPFAVGLHAIQVSQVKPNDRVLILGGGIIGMSCAEWARTFGASEITVSELNPQKREIIRGYQVADHVVAADGPRPGAAAAG